MISTASSCQFHGLKMPATTNGYDCYCESCKFQQRNGTTTNTTTSTGTTDTSSPPSSISPNGYSHHHHYRQTTFAANNNNNGIICSSSSLQQPMSITAQGALERNSANNMTECVAVPSSEHVAEIVGKQGCKIKALRDKTNTYIKTPMRGEESIFVITGRLEDVEIAKFEINQAAEHFTQIRAQRRLLQPPTIPGQVTEKMQVPLRLVGLIVGPKGQTIKRIQQDTNTYIVTPGREKEPVFDITGPKDGVDKARELIAEHILTRTGNTLEELLRQQAEQGIVSRPRSRSADATMTNFDIGCWNVEPEPESDGSDSGMMLGNNGQPASAAYGGGNVLTSHPHATRFASLTTSSPHYAALLQHQQQNQQQQQQQQHSPSSGYSGGMSSSNGGGGTLLAYNRSSNSNTNGYPSTATSNGRVIACSNGTATTSDNNNNNRHHHYQQQMSLQNGGCNNTMTFNNSNNKMRSASFSTAGMQCMSPEIDGILQQQPVSQQQQLHRAATAAAANAGCRHSLQYSSMAEAYGSDVGGGGRSFVGGGGVHSNGNVYQNGNNINNNNNNNSNLQYGNSSSRRCSEPYIMADTLHGSFEDGQQQQQNGHAIRYQQQMSQPYGSTTPTQLLMNGGGGGGGIRDNYTNGGAGIWCGTSTGPAKTTTSAASFAQQISSVDKIMSMMSLDVDNDAGVGGGFGSAAATLKASNNNNSSIWENGSSGSNGQQQQALTNGSSKIFNF